LLLVATLEVERAAIGAAVHLMLAQLDDIVAAGDFFPDSLVWVEVIAALVDIAKVDGVADADLAGIRLLVPGDHLEQGRLTGTVRTNDTDDTAGWQAKFQVVDQQAIPEALGKAGGLDDNIAETFANRNDDLCIAGATIVCRLDQLVIGLDARLGLCLSRLGRCRNPLTLAGESLLTCALLALFLRHALRLGFEVGGVIAFVRDAAAAIEFEDPAGDVVEEV